MGIKLAAQCRNNLTQRRLNSERERDMFLESLALNSDSMIQATRTNDLCRPKWDEGDKNYII